MKIKKIYQHFQNDVELVLRMLKIKTEVMKAFSNWALNTAQLHELLNTVNSSTYLDSSPSVKIRHLILFEIFNSKYTMRLKQEWEATVLENLIKLMYLPYEERQAAFIKIFNLRIDDKVFITSVNNHLYFPFMVNNALINTLDRVTELTVVDIIDEIIIVRTEDNNLLKVPYSIVYKADGSIIYPKKPKTKS